MEGRRSPENPDQAARGNRGWPDKDFAAQRRRFREGATPVRVNLAYVLVALIVTALPAAARAQQYPQQDAAQRLEALERRLEQQEAELRGFRQQMQGAAGPISRLPATDAAFAPDKKDGDKKDADGYVVGSDLSMSAKWNNGVELQTKNKDFRIHIGGRTQIDGSWYSGDDAVQTGTGGIGILRDAVNFRRARLRIDGTMYEVIEFACEYDFANTVNLDPLGTDPRLPPSSLPPQSNPANVPVPTDLWVAATQLPVIGNVKVGNQKDPFGFEHLTSSRWLNFMERSFGQDLWEGPFNNGFTPGISAYNTAYDEHVTWAIGEYKFGQNVYGWGVGDGEYETAGRLTWLPYYDEPTNGRYLLHLGIAGKYADLDENQARFRTRGDIRSGPPGPLNPVFASTLNFIGDTTEQIGLELAGVAGPWSLQAEYFGVWVDDAVSLGGITQPAAGTPLGTTYFQSGYVEVLYFLTGEHRAYNRKIATFDRVVPHENFFLVRTPNGTCAGWGAWQVGVRGQWADLNDSGVQGGQLQAVTLGLNWFLNPNLKVQWNYDWTHRDYPAGTSSGDVHSLGTRVAFDF